jgi:4-amino-4-deoxy-L-arabinose transferase-like glycosyltransferase
MASLEQGVEFSAAEQRVRPRQTLSWRGGQLVTLTTVAVTGLFLLGLSLRLFWVFYADSFPLLGGDQRWYFVVAVNLASGYGYVSNSNPSIIYGEIVGPGDPTAFWPPGYPIVLAGFWKVFPMTLDSAKVFHAVLGALTIPLVYGIGQKLFDRRTGLVAAGLFAVFPNAIIWTPLIISEHLFTFVFVAALWVLVVSGERSRAGWPALVAIGFLTGVAMLTRGQGAVLVPVVFVYWLLRFGWRSALRSTTLALVMAAAVIAPWTARNWVELHAFIPISTNTGTVLRQGHSPDSTGTHAWPNEVIDGFLPWQSLYDPEWEVKGYREYTRRAISYAFTHPRQEFQLSRWKVYHLYRSDSELMAWLTTLDATPLKPDGLQDVLVPVLDYGYYALLLGAAASVLLWFRGDANRSLLLSVFLFWTALHVVFTGEPRYHLPLIPIFCIAVAAGAWILMDRATALRTRLQRRPLATRVSAAEAGAP